jgi:hypothetical protein
MQRRISKFVNGWWNTGTQRRKINKLDFILCPRCKLCRETTDHVLCCSQLSMLTQAHRNTLQSAIISITPDTIANMIMSILCQLSTAPSKPPRLIVAETLQVEVQRSLKKATTQQACIGWFQMCFEDTLVKNESSPTAHSPATTPPAKPPPAGARKSSAPYGPMHSICGIIDARRRGPQIHQD